MPKNTVNLIISKDEEPPVAKRLKIILPIAALICFLVFIIIYIATILYTNNNKVAYNLLVREVERLEKSIASRKNIEGIYTLTNSRLAVLDQLSSRVINFPPVMDEINKLNTNGINIKSVAVDNKGNISFAMSASSSAILDDFVTLMKNYDKEKVYTDIYANGIVKEKKGSYALTITLKKDLNKNNEKTN